ncbi:MAG TPA: class I SAM-dependent methyltransferase [Candidatus Angelobacter sp.]|nr:class I SAM-dependent methyltransferase [Candidatus Angelobacter sp.]
MKDQSEVAAIYDEMAPLFDYEVEDWEGAMKTYVEYIKPILVENHVKTVLDCSCGTGIQAIGLAREGFRVTASDISEEMIRAASNNATKHGVDIEFVQSSFLELKTNFSKKFDAVISMGNAFSHMLTDQDAVKALGNMRSVLRDDNGVCLCDVWNYVTLCARKKRFIPLVMKDDAIVLQVRDFFDPGRVDVNFLYFIKLNDKWQHRNVSMKLRPITTDQLQRFFIQAGFKDISLNVDVLWVRALARTSRPTFKTLSAGRPGVAAPIRT